MILVGDIGGTHTRLALAEPHGNDWRFARLERHPTGGDVAAGVARFLSETGSPALEAAAFCGAGPLATDGRIRLTNADAVLDPAELARAAGVARASVINDFAAVAHAVPRLPPAAFASCGGGAAVPEAPGAVLGPGTGLGMAIFAPAGAGWTVISGEGGHCDLAPVDDEELAVWQRLRRQHGRVSAETVLCGPGLERLHAAIAPGRPLTAGQIAEAAWRGDAGAARAITIFTRWLGRVAGNLALTAGARGGVYLAGGMIPAWGNRFDVRAFRSGFEEKTLRAGWLAGIPSYVVHHAQPGLFGLAVMAAARG